MNNVKLTSLQTRAYRLNASLNASKEELKACIIDLCNELSKQHREHKRNIDLIEAIVENISLSEIANEG